MANAAFPIDSALTWVIVILKFALIVLTSVYAFAVHHYKLIAPKSMANKIKALLVASIISQALAIAGNFAEASSRFGAFEYLFNFAVLNAAVLFYFEVLQIFSVLSDWWKPNYVFRFKVTVLLLHFICSFFYYVGLFALLFGFDIPMKSLFRLGAFLGPLIYAIYNISQSVFVCFLLYRHMGQKAAIAAARGNDEIESGWYSRLKRLIIVHLAMLLMDTIGISTAAVSVLYASLFPLSQFAVFSIHAECLAVGYIFAELRNIKLKKQASGEIQAPTINLLVPRASDRKNLKPIAPLGTVILARESHSPYQTKKSVDGQNSVERKTNMLETVLMQRELPIPENNIIQFGTAQVVKKSTTIDEITGADSIIIVERPGDFIK